jgi:hypothetical protein
MTDPEPAGSLENQAEQFAEELTETLTGSLPGAPGATAAVAAESARVVVQPTAGVELFIHGNVFATLVVRIRCELDSRGTWLAVESSGFSVVAALDRTPLIRFEYIRRPNSPIPVAHIQVHAQRGALSHLLSQADHDSPHDISALHIPVGGSRFRPCIEDVIEFLIRECRFDSVAGWEDTLTAGRARWRGYQAAAVARDFPEEAARTLHDLGYVVTPPATPVELSDEPRHRW